jgi:hypothetical protein
MIQQPNFDWFGRKYQVFISLPTTFPTGLKISHPLDSRFRRIDKRKVTRAGQGHFLTKLSMFSRLQFLGL